MLGPWTTFGDDECCDDVAQEDDCWIQAAADDGIICPTHESAPAGSPACLSGLGCDATGLLCACDSEDDCSDGGDRKGRCIIPDGALTGLCGPSWCNGYKICSCWGGCVDADVVTPIEICAENALACCDGNFPVHPPLQEGQVGSGFCSDDPTCGAGCVDDNDCDDDNPCTEDDCINTGCVNMNLDDTAPLTDGCFFPSSLSDDCARPWCSLGNCTVDYVNEGGVCDENVLPPEAPLTWDAQCWYYGCDDGECGVRQRAEGFPCDDGNSCSAESYCDEAAQCVPSEPNSPAAGECCDPTAAATYDDWNSCTFDWCDGTYHDSHLDLPEFTSCDVGTDVDDTCGVWMCDDSGSCLESTAPFVGLECHSNDGGPGPGGDATYCREWVCSDVVGQEGDCVAGALHEGEVCAWDDPDDTCGRQVCENASCVYDLSDGAACTPALDACCTFECDNHVCTAADCSNPDPTDELCDGNTIGALTTTVGNTISEETGNLCADDDYDVASDGIFENGCAVVDDGEVVHSFSERTHETEYQLRHTLVTVDGDDAWDPLAYAATSCDDTVASPETQSTQTACNNDCDFAGTNHDTNVCAAIGSRDPAFTTGPWPLQDWPTSDETDDLDTQSEYTTYIFADARNTEDPSGGVYTVTALVESHNNNSCINTAEYTAAPRIDGQSSWKERFRGTNSGYTNVFAANGVTLDASDCFTGAATDSDPKTAFFRIDLPGGSETLSQGSETWGHNYKIYTDHYGEELTQAPSIAWRGSNPADGNCSTALSSAQSCSAGSGGNYPREIVVRSSDALRSGWLSVFNGTAGGTTGSYQVSVVRAPRPSLGVSQIFAGTGDGASCCSGTSLPPGTHSTISLQGKRVDFTPTNNDVAGFIVRKATPTTGGTTWLLNPAAHDVVCTGPSCAAPAVTLPYDFGFAFPFAGDFWTKFCIDTAGRIELAKEPGDCVNRWDIEPNTEEFTDDYAPSIAPLWGTIIPCKNVRYPTCFHGSWSTPRDVNCGHSLGCIWNTNMCQAFKWNETTCESNASLYKKFTRFEGTSAVVISWDGFDGYVDPHDQGDNGSLDFQVILRADGRVTFFYREQTDNTTWNDVLKSNGWVVGVSGARAASCATDNECNTTFETTGLRCDTQDVTVSGETIWDARNRCVNPVNFQGVDGVQVSGSWVGE